MKKEICSLSKVYEFCSGHRLYIKEYSDEQNLRIFGKCANQRGHGHNYYLEVRVAGDIDTTDGPGG